MWHWILCVHGIDAPSITGYTERMTTVAITGHRPKALGWSYDYGDANWMRVADGLAKFFQQVEATKVISGMALGTDQVAAMVALSMDIPYVAAVPCDGQSTRWPPKSQALYMFLLESASERIVVSPGPYAVWKMQKRNEYMVDNGDYLAAVWNGVEGGTANCINYALHAGRKIWRINPEDGNGQWWLA